MRKPLRNIGASVRARLLNLAKNRNQPFDLLLTRYVLGVIHLPHMAAAKETTLKEVGDTLTHVVEHMATKEDVARLDTRIDDLREEMIDQFRATHDRLRDIAAEITVIHRRVERLEEQGASNAGLQKKLTTFSRA